MVGVEILLKWIHVSIVRVDNKVAYQVYNESFVLENIQECLNYILSFIRLAIEKSGLHHEQLIGISIGLADILNEYTGEPTLYFRFVELPLAKYVENIFNLPVLINSDTRVIGIAELVLGEAVNCYSFFHNSLQSNPILINAC